MYNIGKLLRKARLEKGLTLQQVGMAAGVGKSTVLKWEKGVISNMRRDKIASLAKVLDLPAELLIGGMDPAEYENLYPLETKKIPLLGEIACGEPIWVNEDRQFISAASNVEADFCLKAKGDSMINAKIFDGDIVFIRRQPTVENGQIAAVIIENEATLKRVYYDKENCRLTLAAENPKYPPLIYNGSGLEQVRILGRAVAVQSSLI